MSKPFRVAGAAAALMGIAWVVPAAAQQAARPAPGPLIIQEQGSFFVGGRDVRSDTLSTLPAYAPSGTIAVDQVYVRYQVPVDAGRRWPVTLVHGCCLTGKTWETTPDGRMGWDEFFVRKGHPTFVVDQAWRGRSAASPAAAWATRGGLDMGPPYRLDRVDAPRADLDGRYRSGEPGQRTSARFDQPDGGGRAG